MPPLDVAALYEQISQLAVASFCVTRKSTEMDTHCQSRVGHDNKDCSVRTA